MYSIEDISVIIPTYNRSNDLKITLKSIVKFKDLMEIIVVDQSKNDKTKQLIQGFKNKKIKYVFSKTPSITIARNIGIKKASKKSQIIIFIDDDVTIGSKYFQEILRVFNEYSDAKAVAGVEIPKVQEKISFLELFARHIFFISHPEKNNSRILSAYGNTYPSVLDRVVNVQWIPGVNMAYKREIFSEQQFDENLLGYTVAEDIDFTYRLFKKCPHGIYMTPFVEFAHRGSRVERYPTEKMAYVNQIDHFYFYFKNMNQTFLDKIKFAWSIFGIFLIRSFIRLLRPNDSNRTKFKYFMSSLSYCLKNLDKIKKGKLRDFEDIM